MACRSLQELVTLLEQYGELARAGESISTELEIASLTSMNSRRNGPALLFENPEGYAMPVLAGAFGSMRRLGIALGISDLDVAGQEIWAAMGMCPPASYKKQGATRACPAGNYMYAPPPCRDIVLQGEEVDLSLLPIPRCWPLDAGPAITLPVIFTRDPETGHSNAGMYRMQVFNRYRTGMHWYPGSGGASHFEKACALKMPLPVAVAIGPDPAVTLAACTPLPGDMDEVGFATMLTGSPVSMTPCIHYDIEVPAMSQVVLEGLVYPGEEALEGPFGTHTGYYSEADWFPVFHVTCMTMRNDAIFPTTVVGPPPQEDCFMARAAERLVRPLLLKKFPDIVDINLPVEGVFNRLAFISIDKQHVGQPEQIMKGLWKMGSGFRSKIIWIFDSEVNIQDMSEVMWRMANHVDPSRDIILSHGRVDSLDPSFAMQGQGCRMGLDCTKKWPAERSGRPWPEEMIMPDEVRRKVEMLWRNMHSESKYSTEKNQAGLTGYFCEKKS